MADYKVNLQLAVKGFRDLKQLNKQVDEARKRLNEASDRSKVFNSRVKDLIVTEKAYKTALTQRTRSIDNAVRAMSGMQTLEQREHQLLKRGNKLRDLRLKKEKALTRQQMVRRGAASAIGSGIIGGGFPLLFGQGPLAAIGGGLGGVAGGALSAIPGMGQFGFALSIAGTTIGSAMEDLTQALQKPTENIENLVGKLGLVGTPTGDLALELEKMGLKSSAAKLLLDQFNEKLGVTPDGLLATSEQLTEFKNKINELGTVITIFLGKALTPFINSMMNNISNAQLLKSLQAKEGTNYSKAQQAIVNKSHQEAQRLFNTTNQGQDIGKSYNQIFDERLSFNLKKGVGMNMEPNQGGMGTTNLATQTFQDKEIKPLKQALEIEKNRLTMSSERLNIMKEEFKLENLKNELKLLESENEKLSTDELTKKIEKLKVQVDLQGQIVNNAKALVDPFRQVSNIIAQDIGDGIRGLIRGTETLGGLLNNVVNKLLDGFINQTIFGNFAGKFTEGEGLLGSLFKANGGPVKGGGSYIVGERGPELFSPGVSGRITPNHALGGSTNIVVNVDASGSSVQSEGDGQQFGEALATAIQLEIVKQKRSGGLLA